MKVLLIQLPQQYHEGKYAMPTAFPLGLGYVAKAGLESGHDVEVLDIWANGYKDEEVVRRIKHLDYDVAGISALSMQYAYVKWLTSELKKCNRNKVIVGNALATHSPELVLRNTEADICVIGEGEITIKEILANLDRLENVKGIWFKQDGEIIKNPPQELIQNLDSIGFPAWELFPTEVYIENNRIVHPKVKSIGSLTSRGCPYNCGFCSKSFRTVRLRSAANIAEEIKELTRRYPQVKGINFWDELFAINKKRVYELCDAIEPLNIKWVCNTRVDLIDLELLQRIKKAGCEILGYGIESGSQTILDRMNKKVTAEQNQNALRDAIKAGILPHINLMFGYPGETKETLRETVDFFKGLPYLRVNTMSRVRLHATMALPGAELYKEALKEGLIKDEDQYLQNLSSVGFTSGRMPINFTGFTEKEFHQLWRRTGREIVWGNVRRHPLHFAIDYSSYLLSWIARSLIEAVPYLRRHGLKQMIRGLIRIVLLIRR